MRMQNKMQIFNFKTLKWSQYSIHILKSGLGSNSNNKPFHWKRERNVDLLRLAKTMRQMKQSQFLKKVKSEGATNRTKRATSMMISHLSCYSIRTNPLLSKLYQFRQVSRRNQRKSKMLAPLKLISRKLSISRHRKSQSRQRAASSCHYIMIHQRDLILSKIPVSATEEIASTDSKLKNKRVKGLPSKYNRTNWKWSKWDRA